MIKQHVKLWIIILLNIVYTNDISAQNENNIKISFAITDSSLRPITKISIILYYLNTFIKEDSTDEDGIINILINKKYINTTLRYVIQDFQNRYETVTNDFEIKKEYDQKYITLKEKRIFIENDTLNIIAYDEDNNIIKNYKINLCDIINENVLLSDSAKDVRYQKTIPRNISKYNLYRLKLFKEGYKSIDTIYQPNIKNDIFYRFVRDTINSLEENIKIKVLGFISDKNNNKNISNALFKYRVGIEEKYKTIYSDYEGKIEVNLTNKCLNQIFIYGVQKKDYKIINVYPSFEFNLKRGINLIDINMKKDYFTTKNIAIFSGILITVYSIIKTIYYDNQYNENYDKYNILKYSNIEEFNLAWQIAQVSKRNRNLYRNYILPAGLIPIVVSILI
jgi:hypothetical protein